MKQFLEKLFASTMLFKYQNQSEATNFIHTYRYGSLLVTSLFYLLQGPPTLMVYKLAVVISMYVAARIITDLYVRHSKFPRQIRAIILFETLVITLMLIPTGGLNSPFIWYALNPVLVAAWYLSASFCWFDLFCYLIISATVSSKVFSEEKLINTFIQHSYLLLVFILITLLVQLLATLLKRLQAANLKKQESLNHIMSLYQIIEAFTNEDDLQTFFKTFTNYASKLTKASMSFFWQNELNSRGINNIYTNTNISNEMMDSMDQQIRTIMEDNNSIDSGIIFRLGSHEFYAVPVKSSTKIFGVLGIDTKELGPNSEIAFKQKLNFLSDLSAIVLERFSVEENNNKLILLEERNRIANEIHDSVSQRLFSISCALFTIQKKWETLEKSEVEAQLSTLCTTANLAIRDLRQSIYCLSTQKSGEKIFFSSVKSYLMDLAVLNNVKINADLSGEEDAISAKLKKCLYRVICEATGNAVRHGKCTIIDVKLGINSDFIELVVEDNGLGFDLKDIKQENSGLGLLNMKNAVKSFGGKWVLTSNPDMGTKLKVQISMKLKSQDQGGIA